MRMSMVQCENDVTRTHLFQKTGKSINVKSVDGIRIRLFRALSRLREICPMKHHPIARFYKPLGACPKQRAHLLLRQLSQHLPRQEEPQGIGSGRLRPCQLRILEV